MSPHHTLDRYQQFLNRPNEEDLLEIARLLSQDIECERVVVRMASREQAVWVKEDTDLQEFPLLEEVWRKAALTGRGMVGFPSVPVEESGPTGTINVNSVRFCLCLERVDADGGWLVGAFLDKKCSSTPFSEDDQQVLFSVLERLRADELDRRSTAWEPS